MNRLWFISLIFAAFGCGPSPSSSPSPAAKKASQSQTKGAANSSAGGSGSTGPISKEATPEIKVVPPTANIGPSKLLCSMLKKSLSGQISAQVACRFDNAGKRVALSDIARTVDFNAKVSVGAGFKADTSNTATWDAIYTFSAKTSEALLSSSLLVNFENTITGENKAFLQMPLSDF